MSVASVDKKPFFCIHIRQVGRCQKSPPPLNSPEAAVATVQTFIRTPPGLATKKDQKEITIKRRASGETLWRKKNTDDNILTFFLFSGSLGV